MNHYRLLSVSLCALFSGLAIANPNHGLEQGFSGGISLNLGYSSGQSQLNTDDNNAITPDLNNNGTSVTDAKVFPLGRLQYSFGETAIFFGNSQDQIAEAQFQSELGILHQFTPDTLVTFAMFSTIPGMTEAWKDPYLTQQSRSKTDQDIIGGRVAFELFAPIPVTLRYAYAQSDIEHDQIGQNSLLDDTQRSLLKRYSQYHRATIETNLPLSRNIILAPAFQYTLKDADGKAHSYSDYAAQLGIVMNFSRHSLVTTMRASVADYEQDNPIFDQKQDANALGVFSIYSFDKPFALPDTKWNVMAGYQETDSDIEFYDESSLFLSTGLAYTF
ncbi:DUF2860 domain-containing protein [Vibrio sp. NTOU-M3]|uniref:DUF2860 domain-containing protein n=1 Tax=Vibrio sp. NTOU-M3 TaxID=3234954 RepID=UPI00349F7230